MVGDVMATDKRQFTLRLPDEVFEKIQAIAKHERRSISVMIEMMILDYIGDYDHPEVWKKKQEDAP